MFQDLIDVCGWAVTAADILSCIRRRDIDCPPGDLSCWLRRSMESRGAPRSSGCHLPACLMASGGRHHSRVSRAVREGQGGVPYSGASSWQGGRGQAAVPALETWSLCILGRSCPRTSWRCGDWSAHPVATVYMQRLGWGACLSGRW